MIASIQRETKFAAEDLVLSYYVPARDSVCACNITHNREDRHTVADLSVYGTLATRRLAESLPLLIKPPSNRTIYSRYTTGKRSRIQRPGASPGSELTDRALPPMPARLSYRLSTDHTL